MGSDGATLKRFLLHDPENPVSLSDLLRTGLWKCALFYSVVVSLLMISLKIPRGRRFLMFFLLNAVPVLSFAIAWRGGDIERYLSLYPPFFLGLAYIFCYVS